MSIIKIVLALALLPFVKIDGAAQSCPLNALSSSGLPSPVPVSLDQFTFDAEPMQSNATVRITNRDTRPINAFFMVVDFQVSHRYLLSMIYYLTTSGQLESFKRAALISPEFVSSTPISSSLLPAGSYRASAHSSLRAMVCPDEGRIAVLQIVFAKGKSFDYRMSGWQVDPALLYVGPWALNGFPTHPISFSGRVSVDEKGQARVVAMGAVSPDPTDDSDLSWWLISQIQDTFKFVPAQYEGAAVSSELEFLFRFYPAGEDDPTSKLPTDSLKRTVTIVDLVSATPGRAYHLIYGGDPMGGESLHPPKSP